MASESKSAVLAALGANGAIAVGKLAAGLITGSAAMLAEAGHSVADTVNQGFLLVGINLSDTEPDAEHPHGYGKDAFFWSFMAAIFIFVAGATFSFYEGGRTLIQSDDHHRTGTELAIAYGVLGMAFLFELVSYTIALRSLRGGAKERGWSMLRYIRKSPDLTTKTVFWEDSAALIGLALAAGGIFISEMTGNEAWDGIASVGIGVVLAAVALMLGLQARNMLIGAAADEDTRAQIAAVVSEFDEVYQAIRILTMQLGAHSVLVSGELHVHGDLSVNEAEKLIDRIDARLAEVVPAVKDTFWELKPGRSRETEAG